MRISMRRFAARFFMKDFYKIAVLDLGTNTFNLLLAKVTASAYYIFYDEKIPVKIGQDGIGHGVISPKAQKRAAKAIIHYKRIIQSEGIQKVYGYATSAFRNARNGKTFKDSLEKQTDLSIQIIPGEMEARFIYEGVNNALDIGENPSLIIDIGGGSVEFILGNNKKILWLKSFEIGAQRLLDLFHKSDPIEPESRKRMKTYLRKKLIELDSMVKKHQPKILIGSSGTFDTLSDIYCRRIHKEIDPYAKEFPLDIDKYDEIHEEIISKDKSARLKIPGMNNMRVDMIVVASCLTKYILDRYKLEGIRVSAHSLKEGMLGNIQNELFSKKRFVAARQ